MKQLIQKSPSSQEVWKLAQSQGSDTLFEDGILKVKNGITTLDEVLLLLHLKKNNLLFL
jgi:type II secretory ATPase GspE/PulE/Tfp pilus assembly ATPase PilB-like protein